MAQNDAVDIAFSTFYTMKSIEVVAGVITDGGRIFATQRGYGDQKDGWEFPGGKMKPGETPEQALVRELQEELDVMEHEDAKWLDRANLNTVNWLPADVEVVKHL